MIVSHHGTHEFGSPKLPDAAFEAIAFTHLPSRQPRRRDPHVRPRDHRDDPCRESSWTPFQQTAGEGFSKGGGNAEAVANEAE